MTILDKCRVAGRIASIQIEDWGQDFIEPAIIIAVYTMARADYGFTKRGQSFRLELIKFDNNDLDTVKAVFESIKNGSLSLDDAVPEYCADNRQKHLYFGDGGYLVD